MHQHFMYLNLRCDGFSCFTSLTKMGRGGASSSSSSSLSSSNMSSLSQSKRDLGTDLRLGLGFSTFQQGSPSTPRYTEQPSNGAPITPLFRRALDEEEEEENECNSATFFVKVYMEGIPIGRKLDLLAHDGYYDLIRTLDQMFNTAIIWADLDCEHSQQCHVLTYEDKEGDWLMVGDVPWQMFLSSVRRLKITRVDT